MSGFLYRLGSAAAGRPWRVVVHDTDGQALDATLLTTVAGNLRGTPDVSLVSLPELEAELSWLRRRSRHRAPATTAPTTR